MEITIRIPSIAELLAHWRWVLLAALVLAFTLVGGASPAVAATANTLTTVDSADQVGRYTSLAIGTDGKPIVSYSDTTHGDLKVAHCGDASCSAGNTLTTVDSTGSVGQHTSIAIGTDGKPVVSYYDFSNQDLKVAHCGYATCAAGNTITTVDSAGNVGRYTSIAEGADGMPVVSYWDQTNLDLKVLHCGNSSCTSGNSITSPDTGGAVGYYTSLALDASGNPVVSYDDQTNAALKVLHCNDANCDGGDESITSPDTGGVDNAFTSLALDASGNPVVSYSRNAVLAVLHCNDVNCAASDDSITSPGTVGPAGYYNSLALDTTGKPVISFDSGGWFGSILRLMHCNDANCAGSDESITSVDRGGNPNEPGDVGWEPSLVLDGGGIPVVSYYDATNGDLKVLHCGDQSCIGIPPQIKITNLGQYALPKTCFQVLDAWQVALFAVCDNDFQGPPASNAVCVPDGVCADDDPALGSILIPVSAGDYRVEESTAAPQHAAVTGKQTCNVTVTECSLTFLNTPKTRPWFPWDLVGTSGPSGPLDGKVTIVDVLAVISKFGQQKPLP